MKLKAVVGALFVCAFLVSPSQAATLYMDPNTVSIERGDTIKVSIRVDTDEGECINAVDGVISYSDQINLVDVSRGSSIFSVWVEEPTIDTANRTLTFAGGIPNGYCGRIAGDPRLTNVIADLVFQSPGFVIGASDSATATVSFLPQTQVLLNDGFGTRADANLYGATIELKKNLGGTVVDEWREVINDDFIPPEEFSISLDRTENAFGNRYFITFNTTDKQSGIAYYEVIEEPLSDSALFTWGRENAPWVRANSPYQLKDQALNSTVRVRAVDKAGNEQMAVLIPDDDERTMSFEVKVFIAVIGTVLAAFVISAIVYVFLRRKRNDSENAVEEEEWEEEEYEYEEEEEYEEDDDENA